MARLDTTKDEELIVAMVEYFEHEATEAEVFRQFAHAYERNWLFYHGHQWLNQDGAGFTDEDKSRINRDIVFNQIRRINPLITDARPVRYIRPDHPDQLVEEMALMYDLGMMPGMNRRPKTDEDIAFQMNDMWRDLEERSMEPMKLAQALTNTTVGGLAWRFPYWHKVSDNEPGEPRVKTIRDSRDILIDPECEEIDLSDARYIIVKTTMDADELQNRYGLSDGDMREILEDSGFSPTSRGDYFGILQGQYTPLAPSGQIFKPNSDTKYKLMVSRPRVQIRHCWYWGQVPQAFDEDGPSKTIENPQGRIFSVAGSKLLRKPRPNPYWHGMFPGVPFRDNPDPTSPYGFSDVNWLIHDQMALNVLVNALLLNATIMGNSRIFAEDGALKGKVTNRPGEVIVANAGKFDRVQFIEGTNIPTSMLGLVNMFDQHAQQRVNDAIQGQAPGAQSSGVAISNLQEAALAIVREKARWLEWSYMRQGMIEVSNMQQFGSHLMANAYLKSHRMDMGEWSDWHDRMRNLDYDIAVESKAELPMNILDRMKVALQQRQMGLIDNQEALDFMKFPVSRRLRDDLELEHQSQKEAVEFQLMQLRAQKQAFEQQMGGGMGQGMGPGMSVQEAPEGRAAQGGRGPTPQLPGTAEQAAVDYPAQSALAGQQTALV